MNSMEAILLNRLSMFATSIKEHRVKASELCACRPWGKDELEQAAIVASKLQSTLGRFQSDLYQYFNLSKDPNADEISNLTAIQLEGDEILAEINARIQAAKDKRQVTSDPTKNRSKLPELDLVSFHGDVLEWTQFWDQFSSNIDQRNLRDVDKLLYLKASLKGEAKTIIDGLETTNDNYQIAVDTLRGRYGNRVQIIDAHYSSLYKIKKATRPQDCRKTLDELERHLRLLQSLGEDTNQNNLRFLFMEKFPEDVIYEMKLKLKTESTEEIRKQLNAIISAKEDAKRIGAETKSMEATFTTETLHIRDKPPKKPTCDRKIKYRAIKMREKLNKFRQSTSNLLSTFTPKKRPYEANKESKNSQVPEKRWKLECIFCQGNHYNDTCMKVKSLSERKGKLPNRCYICLRTGHSRNTCRTPHTCRHCGAKNRHNRALCPKKLIQATPATSTKTFHVDGDGSTVLQTAVVNVIGHEGLMKKCRVLLDSGSQRSYITQTEAKELNLRIIEHNHLFVFVFGTTKSRELDSPLVKLNIQTRNDKLKTIFANVVPSITQGIHFPRQKLTELIPGSEYVLADDGSLSDRIDILIGNDYYFNFMSTGKIQIQENLYLIDTELGWILSGKPDSQHDRNDDLSVLTYFQASWENKLNEPDPPLDTGNVKSLWDLESIGITDSPNVNRDEEAIKHFNENTIFKDNRYFVSWPWNEYPPNLQSNIGLAHGRLISLLKRMDTETLRIYDQTLREQFETGIIEIVENKSNTDHPIHYLSHLGVSAPGKKLRIVYDASAKTKDSKSLNECMYCGPMMLEDLTGLLIKFRCHKIGISADVEKAFLQIGLHNNDRDVTRFLWLKDVTKPAVEENLVHYRFTRVPFGIISSPFLLNATIKHHLSKAKDDRLKSLASDIYVDNVLTGSKSVEEAMSLYKDSKMTFQKISMNLREWSSNSKELMHSIPDANKDKIVKTLGLNWDLEKDTVSLRTKNSTNAYTKRGVLKTIAAIYDPCGFAAPITLPAKLLLQTLWKTKSHWDAPLSEDRAANWKVILEDLKQVQHICLPRNIANSQDGQIHCFTDSSMSAYAAAVYLLQGDKVNFVIGKSRLVPIKDQDNLKIPKLELLGALIGSRLILYVMKYLQVNISQQILWTDSRIVIDWYQSKKLLPPFISRRIEEIKKNKNLAIRYVPSECNPADVSTRPTTSTEDFERWLSGPEFLKKNVNNWPRQPTKDTTLLAGEGLSNDTTQKDGLNSDGENQFKKNVNLNKTKQHKTETRQICSGTQGKVDNRISSEVQEIRRIQRQFYPEEVDGKETHLTRNLGLFKDVDGILRCDGRLTHSDLSYEAKHPILLPKDCDFTTNIIKKTHESLYHVGVPHTLDNIRQRFWIPKGRARVQRFIHKCQQCVKHGGGPYTLPETPALPPERVRYETAYTYVGVDYFGPMYVSAESKQKRWVCLFTCLVVRAIHLEIVKDMSAEECLLAFRRFMATRGVPNLIVTDNALQFKLLSEIMTTKGSTDQRIQWKFIPQLAPWHGGVYERLVAVVKHCLKRTLQKHLLDDNQLLTIIKEVESVVNTRPLTYVGVGLEHVLKPADFLTPGRCLELQVQVSKAPVTATSTKQELIKGWRRGETIIKEYRDMFMNQYLLSLRERYKHSTKQPRVRSHDEPCVGDIVQIKGDTKNRENWKVGSIIELIKGTDGLSRVARVKVDDSIFTRSISHLYPLEVEDLPLQSDSCSPQAEVESAPKEMRMEVEEDSDLPVIQWEDYSNIQPGGNMNGTVNMDTDTAHSTDMTKENTDVTNENKDIEELDTESRHGNEETRNDLVSDNTESTSNQFEEEKQKRPAAIQAMEKNPRMDSPINDYFNNFALARFGGCVADFRDVHITWQHNNFTLSMVAAYELSKRPRLMYGYRENLFMKRFL